MLCVAPGDERYVKLVSGGRTAASRRRERLKLGDAADQRSIDQLAIKVGRSSTDKSLASGRVSKGMIGTPILEEEGESEGS